MDKHFGSHALSMITTPQIFSNIFWDIFEIFWDILKYFEIFWNIFEILIFQNNSKVTKYFEIFKKLKKLKKNQKFQNKFRISQIKISRSLQSHIKYSNTLQLGNKYMYTIQLVEHIGGGCNYVNLY